MKCAANVQTIRGVDFSEGCVLCARWWWRTIAPKLLIRRTKRLAEPAEFVSFSLHVRLSPSGTCCHLIGRGWVFCFVLFFVAILWLLSSLLTLIPLLLPNLFTSSALLLPVSPAGSDAIYLLAPCWVPIWDTGGEVEPSCSQEPLAKKTECEDVMYFYIKHSLSLCLYAGMRSSLGTYTHQ